MNNPFLEYHQQVEEFPERFSEEIHKYIKIQKEMLLKFDFISKKGEKVCNWIEKYCILVDGENAGKPVELLLWQKWYIYSIFCFYGYFDEPKLDHQFNVIGIEKKYLRVITDVLLLIASGNSKTTLCAFINAYLLYASKSFPAAKIYIGSNATKQSRLCFDTTMKIIKKNSILNNYAKIRSYDNTIEIIKDGKNINSHLYAMSSDGKNYEGIIPTMIMIDEIHEMKTSVYANNLRKSVKRDDSFIIETTTQGNVRGGYLDQRLEYAEKILNGDITNYRFMPIIFKQDNVEEIIDAYNNNNIDILLKSNPSLGHAISITRLKEKIKEMLDDESKKVSVLTKNFNIPQNAENVYFSPEECKTKEFDESIFNGMPVFIGLDMAYTRSPNNDFCALTILLYNPLTEEEYYKDFYFLPKYYEKKFIDKKGRENVILLDMVKEKSIIDTYIGFDEKNNFYEYNLYKERGDVIVIDEVLVNEIKKIHPDAEIDMTGVTEQFIIYFLSYIQQKYNFIILKFGLDPNKASYIKSFINENIKSIDGLPIVIDFRMEQKLYSVPIIEETKNIRSRGLVYDNNKLTLLHFAALTFKNNSYGLTFTNPQKSRKDGVIAHLSARSAKKVFLTNSKTGNDNLLLLKEVFYEKMANGNLQEF